MLPWWADVGGRKPWSVAASCWSCRNKKKTKNTFLNSGFFTRWIFEMRIIPSSIPSSCPPLKCRFYLFNSAICLLPRIIATSQRQTSSLWASLYCWQLVLLHCHKMEMSGTAWERGSSPNCRRSSHLPSKAYCRYLLWLRCRNQSRNRIQRLPTGNDTLKKIYTLVFVYVLEKTLLIFFVTVATRSRPDEASFS